MRLQYEIPGAHVFYIGARKYQLLRFNPARREAEVMTWWGLKLIVPFAALSLTPPQSL